MVMKHFENLKWAVVGGGNGGQAFAGLLGAKGFSVKLYDIFQETVDVINKQGGIQLEGSLNEFGKVEVATTNMEEAISEADVILVVTPAVAHQHVAKNCAPYLKDNQVIVLNPGSACGVLEFNKVIREEGCKANVTLADVESLLFACRSERPGQVHIFGVKQSLRFAAFPGVKTERTLQILNRAFPQFIAAQNVLETGFDNLNVVLHPLPTLLNVVRIDEGIEFLYYYDGITKSVAGMLEGLDKERVAIGKKLGLNLTPVSEWFREKYDAKGSTLYDIIHNNKAYDGIKGPSSLNTRYIWEDVPKGLVPIAEFGKLLNIPTPYINLVISLAEQMAGEKVLENSRTLETLGLFGMSAEEIQNFVQTGSFDPVKYMG